MNATPSPSVASPVTSSPPTGPPKLLDQVRAALRSRHCNSRTEELYVDWIRRFILFHNKRHPAEMAGPEVSQFLTHLAVEEHVTPSIQTQARAGLVFLYRHVLLKPLGGLEGVVRARRPESRRRGTPRRPQARDAATPAARPQPRR